MAGSGGWGRRAGGKVSPFGMLLVEGEDREEHGTRFSRIFQGAVEEVAHIHSFVILKVPLAYFKFYSETKFSIYDFKDKTFSKRVLNLIWGSVGKN